MQERQEQEVQLNIASVARGSMFDGPGPRTVVWFQGCAIRCPGCQNPELWGEGGQWFTPAKLAEELLATGEDITITGGEPFSQVAGLASLLQALEEQRREGRERDIIIYTGYELEHLLWRYQFAWARFGGFHEDMLIGGILAKINTLVDGPYRAELDDDHMQWRGSSNQRAIDMPKSCAMGLLESHLPSRLTHPIAHCIVERDWDTPIIQITEGQIVATGGTMVDLDLASLGAILEAPLCGQVDYSREAEKAAHHREDQERRP